MKIAILGIKTLPAFAGADRVVERLLEHFPDGHEYYVYLLKNEKPELRCSENYHYIYLPALSGKHVRAFSFFAICTLHFLLKGNYDIAHVHNEDFGFFVPFLKLKRRVKIIGTFHGSAVLHPRKKWGIIATWYSADIGRNFRAGVRLRHDGSKIHLKHCSRIENRPRRIYTETVLRTILEKVVKIFLSTEKFGLKRKEYILFACGRLDSTKGLHHLIKAYNKKSYNEKLFIIGDASHDRAYDKYIQNIAGSNANIVIHHGLLPKELLYEVIRNCRVFVFPSEYERCR